MKIVYNKATGAEVIAYEDPKVAGRYALPANSTEIAPPTFDAGTHTCSFDGNQWVVTQIPTPEPEPTPDPIPAIDLLRHMRNGLLFQTDWRMTTDYPYNDQAQWASYRTALRNLPATSEPTLDDNGNLIVDWPTAPSEV